jgi:hypothetical protein
MPDRSSFVPLVALLQEARRSLASVALIITALACAAQPQPPSIMFTLAAGAEEALAFDRAHRVEMHYREMNRAISWGGEDPEQVMVQVPGLLFADTASRWLSYRIPDCYCFELCVLVIAGDDTMQLDLPNGTNDRDREAWNKLVQRTWSRWDQDTPEVIRFRPGRFAFADVVVDPWAAPVTARFAAQLVALEEARHQQLVEAEAEYRRQRQ